ncbi:hypothetical protein FB451DRAFT_1188275 [Mycena latifolia]|nr:hypothetical protein FB451DRAFT_1188275 [Mycena latifolia]
MDASTLQYERQGYQLLRAGPRTCKARVPDVTARLWGCKMLLHTGLPNTERTEAILPNVHMQAMLPDARTQAGLLIVRTQAGLPIIHTQAMLPDAGLPNARRQGYQLYACMQAGLPIVRMQAGLPIAGLPNACRQGYRLYARRQGYQLYTCRQSYRIRGRMSPSSRAKQGPRFGPCGGPGIQKTSWAPGDAGCTHMQGDVTPGRIHGGTKVDASIILDAPIHMGCNQVSDLLRALYSLTGMVLMRPSTAYEGLGHIKIYLVLHWFQKTEKSSANAEGNEHYIQLCMHCGAWWQSELGSMARKRQAHAGFTWGAELTKVRRLAGIWADKGDVQGLPSWAGDGRGAGNCGTSTKTTSTGNYVPTKVTCERRGNPTKDLPKKRDRVSQAGRVMTPSMALARHEGVVEVPYGSHVAIGPFGHSASPANTIT